ncbi:pyrophosphohydrolase domain-containing protein [Herbiconiux daphne]|uniref:Pyrophosphatase n=1 Tax=Herbiconiux daphne TaxID=2970914 RepID=A0ABT2H7A8_9MICO|nr:MazG nucleotide pyrophosphohydrolase domain-containing protein [Herbiconiux daphne]MCS5735806.1 pyrophosphatase [Herbiconiux daphne]
MSADIEGISADVEGVSGGYAEKFGIERTDAWFMLKLQEEVGELTQAFIDLKGMGRDRGRTAQENRNAFAQECADVLAHILLLARHEGIDLTAAIDQKWLRWARATTADEATAPADTFEADLG